MDQVSAMESARVEGKLEGKFEARRETVVRLLRMGMQLDDVATATGLSVEDIPRPLS